MYILVFYILVDHFAARTYNKVVKQLNFYQYHTSFKLVKQTLSQKKISSHLIEFEAQEYKKCPLHHLERISSS